MSTKHKKITIYQVAERAGVAISTVSRVLNDSPNVSEQTKRKVKEAITELNFRPQVSARNLASRKPQMLAIAVPSFTTPFFNEVLKGVKDEIREMDLDIIIYNTGSKNPEVAVENFFDRGTADALIAISININERIHEQIQGSGIPTVLVGASHPEYNYYELNDFNGGFIAADHLIKQGFQKLSMIMPAIDTKASEERRRGFIEAMREYHIPVDERFFVRGESTKHAGFTEEAGYEAVYRIKELGEFPEAIFCVNDTQAIGAFHGLNRIGLKIPDDIALMGYDNIKFTRYLDLTTVDQQMHKVGMMATRKLAEIIKNPDLGLEQTRIQPILVKRNSTRKV